MLRKEQLILAFAIAAVVVALGVASALVVRALHQEAEMVCNKNLPSLVAAGAALVRLQENWAETQNLVRTSPEQRMMKIARIEKNSSEVSWAAYARSLESRPMPENYVNMVTARTAFVNARAEFFQVLLAGDEQAAVRLLDSQVTPAFNRYRNASQSIFSSDAAMGEKRASELNSSLGSAAVVVGIMSGLLFLLGVFLGVAGAFRGLTVMGSLRQYAGQ